MSINITLIGQIITFALLIWFVMEYVWPVLFEKLEERKQKIADGLAAAERGHEEILLAEQKAKGLLKSAKDQSSEIVSQAQKQANEIVADSKNTAKKEGDRLILAAKAQIDQEVQQSKETLRKEVAALAVTAAEQILVAEIDKTKHQEIVNKISKRL
jgi:F-type H+-transporting ATPase subunit b